MFLVAGAVHIVADARNFARALNYRDPKLHTVLRAAMVGVSVVAGVVPPPHLVCRAAKLRNVPFFRFATNHMRPVCWAVFLLFYIPHLLIPIYHLRALRIHWFVKPGRLVNEKAR